MGRFSDTAIGRGRAVRLSVTFGWHCARFHYLVVSLLLHRQRELPRGPSTVRGKTAPAAALLSHLPHNVDP